MLDVAAKHDIGYRRLRSLLKKNGVPVRPRGGNHMRPPLTAEEKAGIAEAYKNGERVVSIAERFRISLRTIYPITREFRIQGRYKKQMQAAPTAQTKQAWPELPELPEFPCSFEWHGVTIQTGAIA